MLYVSEAVPAAGGGDPVGEIVAASRERNAALGITGALIFTGGHFAQVLEGSPEAVEELMANIRCDPRHRNVRTVEMVNVPERRFPGWSLAYSGHSSFVDRHIRPLMEGRDEKSREVLCQRLIGLMRQFGSGRS